MHLHTHQAKDMETLGRRRRVAVLAWCNAIAMALALATPVAAVAANHGDTAAKDNVAVVPRIAASAAAAASSVNVTAICMATPYPSACETALSTIAPDAVVALDGSGTHTSISDAIAAVTAPPPPAHHPTASGGGGGGGSRKVIYVKAGRYEESVSITSKQKDVMLLGDGKGKTVISGHRSVAGGYTTYASATVAAMGSGFIAKGLTIVNSAGPGKGQAVALRVGADLSVVYNCGIEAYQDTLYVHSNRQFYAADDISGTVDFIFGNAAAVIQGCEIRARRPGPGQEDTVTAQGRSDPNQNTGISIHRCRITGAPDLGGTPVYLGRPWRRYSRTVVMGTFLDRSIAPAGWLEWSGQFGLSTLYYGEYGNTGPGAGTRRRVTWSGVHTLMSTSDATRFTVANFIVGDAWLPATGVTYTSGL
uniref:Pectinesterase n=1 Tax=Oryza nivara TaxID=4536 RepID=A0A0E0GDR2_ORYNI